jgi:hypothetical protein
MANDSPRSVLLVHGKLCGADLLVVRIDKKGNVLPPLIIFKDFEWEDHEFCQITNEESVRIPPDVKIGFWEDTKGRTCLHEYFGTNGYCVKEDIQACVILPLDPELYDAHDKSSLPKRLGLDSLLTEAWAMNYKWCHCGRSDEFEDDIDDNTDGDTDGDTDDDTEDEIDDERLDKTLILCDSTKCKYGWYHMKCLKLSEPELRVLWKNHKNWFCEQCKTSLKGDLVKTKYDNGMFRKKIYDASDKRIQRARSFWKVWERHQWPTFKRICVFVKDVEEEWDQKQGETKISIKKLQEEVDSKRLQCRRILISPSLS